MHFNSTANTIIAQAPPWQIKLQVKLHLVVVSLFWETNKKKYTHRVQSLQLNQQRFSSWMKMEVMGKLTSSVHSDECCKMAGLFQLKTEVLP